MDILQREDMIKGLPDNVLFQKAQETGADQFLFVSEIQRRQKMRDSYAQSQSGQPEETVVEQILNGGIAGPGQPNEDMQAAMGAPPGMPPGQQQGPPQGPPMGAPPPGMPPGMPPQGMPPQGMPPAMVQGMPPGMPPQGMAGGGVVRMANLGQVPGVQDKFKLMKDQGLNYQDAFSMASKISIPGIFDFIDNLYAGDTEIGAGPRNYQGPVAAPQRMPSHGNEFSQQQEPPNPDRRQALYHAGVGDLSNLASLISNKAASTFKGPPVGELESLSAGLNPLGGGQAGRGQAGVASDAFSGLLKNQPRSIEEIKSDYNNPLGGDQTGRGLGAVPGNFDSDALSRLFKNKSSGIEEIKSAYNNPLGGGQIGGGRGSVPGIAGLLNESSSIEEVKSNYNNPLGGSQSYSAPVVVDALGQPQVGTVSNAVIVDGGKGGLSLDGDVIELALADVTPKDIVERDKKKAPQSLSERLKSLGDLEIYNQGASKPTPKVSDFNLLKGNITPHQKQPQKDYSPLDTLIEQAANLSPPDLKAEAFEKAQGAFGTIRERIADVKNRTAPTGDYAQHALDYGTLITEQESRARKIRADAKKEAGAQALIQLGAGIAEGDISAGLRGAGKSASEAMAAGRKEASAEDMLARNMRIAQAESNMNLGIRKEDAALRQFESQRTAELSALGQEADIAAAEAGLERGIAEFEYAASKDAFDMAMDKIVKQYTMIRFGHLQDEQVQQNIRSALMMSQQAVTSALNNSMWTPAERAIEIKSIFDQAISTMRQSGAMLGQNSGRDVEYEISETPPVGGSS